MEWISLEKPPYQTSNAYKLSGRVNSIPLFHPSTNRTITVMSSEPESSIMIINRLGPRLRDKRVLVHNHLLTNNISKLTSEKFKLQHE